MLAGQLAVPVVRDPYDGIGTAFACINSRRLVIARLITMGPEQRRGALLCPGAGNRRGDAGDGIEHLWLNSRFLEQIKAWPKSHWKWKEAIGNFEPKWKLAAILEGELRIHPT